MAGLGGAGASLGGSGSSSKNFDTSSFGQRVMGAQIPQLKNLWNTANSQQAVTGGLVNTLVPGAVDNQNQTASIAQGGLSDQLNGGAYAGINGADIARGMSGQMSPLQPIGSGASQSGFRGFFSPPAQLALPGQMQSMTLPGAINSRQSDLLSQLRASRNTNASVGNFSQADTTNPFGTGPTATQQIYAGIMGGRGNTYADALKNQMQIDANLAQNNMLNNLDQRVASNGMGGSSRLALAQAQGMKDINTNLQRDLTQVGYDTFDKDLINKLNIASQADANRLGAYKAGLDYNSSLANAQNQATGLNQTYNSSIGGLANQNNQNNQNYNLGLGSNVTNQNIADQNYNLGFGQNVNAANQNAQNYNLGMNQSAANYNLGMANANNQSQLNDQTYNLGLAGNNTALQGLLGGMVANNQGSRQNALGAAQGVQSMWGAPMQTALSPWQSISNLADTIGGPIILGQGSSMGKGSSKGGGGGLSLGAKG